MPKKFLRKQINSFHPVRDLYLQKNTRKQKSAKSLTEFQEKVYKIIKEIPKGQILTYKKVAEFAGSPKAWRAVGNILAENKNPQIPCHRVIRSDGKAGGYNQGTKKKIALLKKEGVVI